MITYLKGDATEPVGEGTKIVAHVCNDIGAWGRGFVLSVTKKWPEAEADYRNWYQQNPPRNTYDPPYPEFVLGNVRCVKVSDDIYVANMIAQTGIFKNQDGRPPIRYHALKKCLETLAHLGADSIHMPRIGCGLAGGTWEEVEKIINETLTDMPVFVYDFESDDARTIAWKK